ncbi:MAG: hypothetical protein ACLRNQ_22115 [Flavonifractor plautii]
MSTRARRARIHSGGKPMHISTQGLVLREVNYKESDKLAHRAHR